VRIPGRTLATAAAALAVAIGVFLFSDREQPVLTDHAGFSSYRKYCRRCHGYSGEGKRASRMAERPVSLVSAAFRDTVEIGDVERIVAKGKGKMKAYEGKLSPEQLLAVAQYVLDLPEAP
jgi:mono/diheme cytochrome c family protein